LVLYNSDLTRTLIQPLTVTRNETNYFIVQDYESRILTLQEQLERHSLMSSMTPDDFDLDNDDIFGTIQLLSSYYTL